MGAAMRRISRLIEPSDAIWLLLKQSGMPLISKVFMSLAVVVLCLAGAASALVQVTYATSEENAAAMSPQVLDTNDPSFRDEDVQFSWGGSWDSIDSHPVQIHSMAAVSANAPTPPGLDEWPAIGSVFVSPQLIEEPWQAIITERYGEISGTIPSEILSSPTEMLVYTFPSSEMLDTNRVYPAANFGGPGMIVSEILYRQPAWMFHTVLLSFCLIGGVGLLVVSSHLDDRGYRRNIRIGELLGISRTTQSRLAIARVLPSVSVGATIAFVLLLFPVFLPISVPITGWVISPTVMRAGMGPILIGFLVSIGVALGIAFADSLRQTSVKAQRRTLFGYLPPSIATAIFLVVTVSIIPIFQYFSGMNQQLTGTIVLLIQTALALVTLPAAITAVTGILGRFVAWIGRKRSDPSWLLAGRQLQLRPAPSAKAVASLMLTMLVVTQVQLWVNTLNKDERALDAYLSFQGHALESKYPMGEQFKEFESRLSNSGLSWTGIERDSADRSKAILTNRTGIEYIIGTTSVSLNVSELDDTPLKGFLQYNAFETLEIQDSAASPDSYLLIVGDGTSKFDENAAIAIANQVSGPPIVLETPGQSAVVAAGVARSHSLWISLFGTVGASLLLISAVLGAANAGLNSKHETGALASIGAESRVAYQAGALEISIPTIVGLALSIPFCYVVGYPHIDPTFGIEMPWVFMLTTIAAVLLSLVAIARYVGRQAMLSQQGWMPGRSDNV